ncbi:CIA30 family protein [Bacillus sp. PR5]|nr:CIA30 family protein [Bacillus sp. PR5]
MMEDFKLQPETRWRFFTDTVMGGASSGQMRFVAENGRTHAQMTGRVSLENNGGFIQMQMDPRRHSA